MTYDVTCPVCGCVHKKGEEEHFAPLVNGTPDKEQEEAAFEKLEELRRREGNEHSRLESIKAEILQRRENLVGAAAGQERLWGMVREA